MFVLTPSNRNSLNARSVRVTASPIRGDDERTMTFARSESNAVLVR